MKENKKRSTNSGDDFEKETVYRSSTEGTLSRSFSNIEDQQQESESKVRHWCRC